MGVRLGRYLAAARERGQPKLSQDALGTRIGRGRITIHNWEAGKSTPSHADRLVLAALLDLDPIEMNRLADLDRLDGATDEEIQARIEPRLKSLPQTVRVWIQEFLTDITRGGADDVEVENARTILTQFAMTSYGAGSVVRLSDDDLIQSLESVGEGGVKRVLRRRGRAV